MSIETMKQALEALEVSTDWDLNATGKQGASVRAIIALRQAIATEESLATQEPVAIDWSAVHKTLEDVWHHELSADEGLDEMQDLINTHPQPKAEQEPKREWVGLTLDESSACYEKSGGNLSRFAKAIEAKLKEKNT